MKQKQRTVRKSKKLKLLNYSQNAIDERIKQAAFLQKKAHKFSAKALNRQFQKKLARESIYNSQLLTPLVKHFIKQGKSEILARLQAEVF